MLALILVSNYKVERQAKTDLFLFCFTVHILTLYQSFTDHPEGLLRARPCPPERPIRNTWGMCIRGDDWPNSPFDTFMFDLSG